MALKANNGVTLALIAAKYDFPFYCVSSFLVIRLFFFFGIASYWMWPVVNNISGVHFPLKQQKKENERELLFEKCVKCVCHSANEAGIEVFTCAHRDP